MKLIAVVFAVLLPVVNAQTPLPPTATVGLMWKPSPSANVAGYYMLVGNESRSYTGKVDVLNYHTCTISNLVRGVRYYFTVVAYSSFGDESPQSNEVDYTPPTALALCSRPESMRVTEGVVSSSVLLGDE